MFHLVQKEKNEKLVPWFCPPTSVPDWGEKKKTSTIAEKCRVFSKQKKLNENWSNLSFSLAGLWWNYYYHHTKINIGCEQSWM